MKHWYALMAIATVALGSSLGCSGGDSGTARGAAGAGAVLSPDQSSISDGIQPPWNVDAPANNSEDTAFNAQDPLPNPDQPSTTGTDTESVCDQFCSSVDPHCFGDCSPTCDTLRLIGDVCLAETNALFTCATRVHFACDQDGQLRGGDACADLVQAWEDCIDARFGNRSSNDQSSGRTVTIAPVDAGTAP